MLDLNPAVIKNIIRLLDGIDPESDEDSPLVTDTNVNQLGVLLQAFEIFEERNAKRRDLWKRFGAEDSALHIRSKASRVCLVLERELEVPYDSVMDDALDLINCAVFFVRNVREA